MKQAIPIVILGFTGLGLAVVGMRAPDHESRVITYATTLVGRTPNQRHNAELSARAIHHKMIGPGETFSFCETVGSWSSDTGFKKAPVSYNGQLIDSWGGGVCQTSTTLYNAALLAGFDIVERTKHRFAPSYVIPGRDSAVAFPRIDLKIRNPYDFPVTIRASRVGDRLQVSFWAKRSITTCELQTKLLDTQSPDTYMIKNISGGTRRVRNTGKNGYEVMTSRFRNGKHELVSHDHYPVMHRVMEAVSR